MNDDTPPPQQPTDADAPVVDTVPREQYFRLAADFDNYRKAMDQQLIEISRYGIQRVVVRMVDVLDLVEHAMTHATDAVRKEAEWFRGLEKIQQQFLDTMKEFGVIRIETAGKKFDPATMEALSQVPGGEADTVASEFRAGYMLHDRVIRPARVIVYSSQ